MLIVGSGVIYPAVYMRQNFEGSMLETFDITRAQLAECHSILGVIFFLTYLPSGWLSDKLPTRWLISVSMAGTGVFALWLSTAPDYAQIKWIFIGWGVTSGLTLWGALIKGTSLLAPTTNRVVFLVCWRVVAGWLRRCWRALGSLFLPTS